MRVAVFALAAGLAAAGCASVTEPDIGAENTAGSAQEALRSFYAGLSFEHPALPNARAPELDAVFQRIALGSCLRQDLPGPTLTAAAASAPDVMIMMGDNVYGDAVRGDASLPELREAYADLAAREDMQSLAEAAPILAVWDDHDYGFNDAGVEFAFKEYAQELFADFFQLAADDPRRARPGAYDSAVYGPEGRRVQVILLDTRYFRSPLERDETRAYIVDPDPANTVLGDAQWAWLDEQLRVPAELRFIVSSIQIVAEGHTYERWGNFPTERQRLFDLVAETGAEGVVFLSGDRHIAALYRDEEAGPYPMVDFTVSSLTHSWRDGAAREFGPHQVERAVGVENFGLIDIDWDAEVLAMRVLDEAGEDLQSHQIAFAELRSTSAE